MIEENQAVLPLQRLAQLDIIRGVAILGILLINIYAFAMPPLQAHQLYWHEGGFSALDEGLFAGYQLLIQGRFITLFTLLFGVSLLLLHERYGLSYLRRRLRWLAVFGLLHGCFIWFGDILLWYALTGLFILRRGYLALDSKQLYRKALLFFLVGQILSLVTTVIVLSHGSYDAGILSAEQVMAEQSLWTGSYLAQVTAMLQLTINMFFGFLLSQLWYTAGIMLLGVALYKSDWFHRGYNSKLTTGLFVLALLLSAAVQIADSVTHYQMALNIVLPIGAVAALLMALAYASWLIRSDNTILAAWLIPCGRLSLTLYLGQSIVMVLLFRVIKPEWFASLDRAILLLIACSAIVIQLLLCRGYFRYFNQGPMEYLWRKLSRVPQSQ